MFKYCLVNSGQKLKHTINPAAKRTAKDSIKPNGTTLLRGALRSGKRTPPMPGSKGIGGVPKKLGSFTARLRLQFSPIGDGPVVQVKVEFIYAAVMSEHAG